MLESATRHRCRPRLRKPSDSERYVWSVADYPRALSRNQPAPSPLRLAHSLRLSRVTRSQSATNKELPHTMRKLRRPDLITSTVDGEIVVLDRAAGYVHQLNATASQIWRACDGRQSVEDIVAQVTEHFGGAAETVLKDVTTAVAEFERLGLLLDGPPGEPFSDHSTADRGRHE
jgi:hypothetical protein